MAAEKGNQHWKKRSKNGRDKLFENPQLLWDSAVEYFEMTDANNYEVVETTQTSKGNYDKVKKIERPYSKAGWFIYIGCSDTWLTNFKKTADNDFLRVIEEIEMIIEENQFSGAVVGIFKENIISRKLGLSDKKEIDADINSNITGSIDITDWIKNRAESGADAES